MLDWIRAHSEQDKLHKTEQSRHAQPTSLPLISPSKKNFLLPVDFSSSSDIQTQKPATAPPSSFQNQYSFFKLYFNTSQHLFSTHSKSPLQLLAFLLSFESRDLPSLFLILLLLLVPTFYMNTTTSSSCIPRILRRILCFGTLSSSSLDRFRAGERDDSVTVTDDGLSTQGCVVRLMGLESRIEQRDLRSLQWSDFPAYQEMEDEHFFILSFESRKRSNRRESLRRMDKENDDVNTAYNRDSDYDIRKNKSQRRVQNSCQKKPRKQRMKLRLQEEEDLENLSPNSVLEFAEFPSEHEETASSSSSGEYSEFSRLMNSKLRRTLSEELENCGQNAEEKQSNNGDGAMGRKLKNREWNYDEYWDQMGRLAAREMLKSNWVDHEISVENQDYVKEICRDVASEILDLMLDELMIILSF